MNGVSLVDINPRCLRVVLCMHVHGGRHTLPLVCVGFMSAKSYLCKLVFTIDENPKIMQHYNIIAEPLIGRFFLPAYLRGSFAVLECLSRLFKVKWTIKVAIYVCVYAMLLTGHCHVAQSQYKD